jgi:hypothetical protein
MTGSFMGEALPYIALSLTVVVHLITTVWWAASITRRVEYIERWTASHEHTAERLASLEQRIEHLSSGILRIEDFIRHQK